MAPKTTIMVLLAAAIAALVAFTLVTREDYGDPAARQLIERETAAKH
jgi:hypothetical protein